MIREREDMVGEGNLREVLSERRISKKSIYLIICSSGCRTKQVIESFYLNRSTLLANS